MKHFNNDDGQAKRINLFPTHNTQTKTLSLTTGTSSSLVFPFISGTIWDEDSQGFCLTIIQQKSGWNWMKNLINTWSDKHLKRQLIKLINKRLFIRKFILCCLKNLQTVKVISLSLKTFKRKKKMVMTKTKRSRE